MTGPVFVVSPPSNNAPEAVVVSSPSSNDSNFDANEECPQRLKDIFKALKSRDPSYQPAELALVVDTADLSSDTTTVPAGLVSCPQYLPVAAFEDFIHDQDGQWRDGADNAEELEILEHLKEPDVDVEEVYDAFAVPGTHPPQSLAEAYSVTDIPGLIIYPNLLPKQVQQHLLGRLLNRDLANKENTTNIHLEYDLVYPSDVDAYPDGVNSLFQANPTTIGAIPKDSSRNNGKTYGDVLEKKLSWITLGGQYDWDLKAYKSGKPPDFPPDIISLVGGLFPAMVPQAAIVNVYRSNRPMNLHRDIAEMVAKPLVSISLGCSALFVIGFRDKISDDVKYKVIKLNSGDGVYMSGKSRYAWHGVPKIFSNTSPDYFESEKLFPYLYKDYMKDKRINLNVRQMF